MLAEGDSPKVGTERNMLGLRPTEKDLSVYLDYRRIWQPIRPKDVPDVNGEPGANPETVLFEIDEADLAPALLALGTPKPDTHAPIIGSTACDHKELHQRVVSTVSRWKKVNL
ncbi:MAG: hypothetical protein KF729_09090 [Sandaracinaceae bacterium]|nr:hypothetical protein [Sandaracinaceae bacterium]